MSFNLIGTEYGGWMLDLELVPRDSTIISAGVGEDISFDLHLMKTRACKIVGVDPTPKSHRFIESQKDLNNFELIKMALHSDDGNIIKMYKNKRSDHVSESILLDHQSVNNFDSYFSETISLPSLLKKYDNISVIKMDIEGSEYDVIQSLKNIPNTVKQFCVEFHHFCTSKTIEDTKEVIKMLAELGFKNYVEKPSTKQLNELTFWRGGERLWPNYT